MSMMFLTEDPSIMQLWTDGAINIRKNELPGGWSFVCVHKKMIVAQAYGGVLHTTSQRMELTAAWKALQAMYHVICNEDTKILNDQVKELRPLIKEFEILSDSAYLVNCMICRWYDDWLKNNWISKVDYTAIKNRDLWDPILTCKDLIEGAGYKLTFRKVKGHSGLMYNEVADSLAVKGKLSMY